MEDIAPELLNKIQSDFQNQFNKNDTVLSVYNKIRDGTATYNEANEFALEVGDILAKSFGKNISSDVLPDGKMYYNIAQRVLNPTLKNNYEIITDVTEQVQKLLNDGAKIGIKPLKPDLNQDRIDGIIYRVSEADKYDDVAWILDEPVRNFSQSIVDSSIRVNAEFHAKAGMRPVIVRKLAAGCCEWCANLAGTYEYPGGVPKDVYRRHQRCRCTVDYNPWNGKVQNVHTKEWRKDVSIKKTDYMGQSRIYEAVLGGNKYAIKAYKNDNYENIWCQTYSSESKRICEYLDNSVNVRYPGVEQIIVAKNRTLQGIAAYDYEKRSLFICEELVNEEFFSKKIDKNYFAARNLDDVLIHELGGHKKHWEAVERYFYLNKCNSISIAKEELEMKLREYIKKQMSIEYFYLKNIVSDNAFQQFSCKRILNECIADATILIERNSMKDSYLAELVEEVINYDGNAK